MRSVFFIAFVLLSGLITYGQIEKPILRGNYSLGGNFGFSSSSQTSDRNDDLHNRDFNFSPSLGYFFIDRLTIGLSPVLSLNKNTHKYSQIDSIFDLKYNNSSKITSLGLASFVKYYFTNGIFVTGKIKYSKNWGESDNAVDGYIRTYDTQKFYDETKSNFEYTSLCYELGIGYAYFINSKVSIDCSLNYEKEKQIKNVDLNKRDWSSSKFLKSDFSTDLSKSTFFISAGLNIFL